jgi:hypothetical protein
MIELCSRPRTRALVHPGHGDEEGRRKKKGEIVLFFIRSIAPSLSTHNFDAIGGRLQFPRVEPWTCKRVPFYL